MQSEAPVPPPSHGKGGPLEQIGAFCGFFHLASDGILSLFQIPRHHFWEAVSNDINSASKGFDLKLKPMEPIRNQLLYPVV